MKDNYFPFSINALIQPTLRLSGLHPGFRCVGVDHLSRVCHMPGVYHMQGDCPSSAWNQTSLGGFVDRQGSATNAAFGGHTAYIPL